MGINAVSTSNLVAQAQELEKKQFQQEKNDVSFWSSDWTAGNFVRENIGWDGLADWLDDKDKVCTDGQDDGKLGVGETLGSIGKGFFGGIFKGAMNHPVATAVTLGLGAAAVALTGGAILPAMIASGGVLGAGMIGVGAYKASQSDNDGDAKRAFETVGTGLFSVGASVLGGKFALDQAAKAGVTSAQGAKNMSIGKAFVQNFKSLPEALKMSGLNTKGNVQTWLSALSGEKVVYAHSNKLQGTYEIRNQNTNAKESIKFVQEGTKINTANGVKTTNAGEVVVLDAQGAPRVATIENVAKNNTFDVETGFALLREKGVKLENVGWDSCGSYIHAEINGQKHAVAVYGEPSIGHDLNVCQKWTLENLNKFHTDTDNVFYGDFNVYRYREPQMSYPKKLWQEFQIELFHKLGLIVYQNEGDRGPRGFTFFSDTKPWF